MEPVQALELSAWVVALIGGSVVPLLTGVATKLTATSGVKALVGLALSALVTALAAIVQAAGRLVVTDVLVLFATTFTTHVVTYYGLWKPVGGGAAPGARATESKGIG